MNISRLSLTDFSTGLQVDVAALSGRTPLVKSFNFFGEKPVEEEKEFTKTQVLSELKKAEHKGFEEGYQKAKKEMDNYISTEDIRIKEQLASMLARFSEGLGSFRAENEKFKLEVAKIASYGVRKIFADKVNEKTEEIVLDAISKSAELIKKEPVVNFKAGKNLIEKLKPTAETFFREKNIETKINFEESVNSDDSYILIEWGNSGIKIDLNERMQEIEKIFAEFIKSI